MEERTRQAFSKRAACAYDHVQTASTELFIDEHTSIVAKKASRALGAL